MVTRHKIGLIINGDIDSRKWQQHAQNAEQAAKALKRQGYEVYAVNPKPLSTPVDHYTHSDMPAIEGLIGELKTRLTPSDELVIYATGHGDIEELDTITPNHANAGICIDNNCSEEPLKTWLDTLPHGQRVFIIDACQGGNWQSVMLNDPNTLFISAGSMFQNVCCEEFAPRFWTDDSKSWQERFASVLSKPVESSSPVMMQSPGYVPAVKSQFPKTVTEVDSYEGLQAQLSRLTPGQYAIMTFSAEWCAPCQEFRPQFDELAKNSNGQYLFLRTESDALSAQFSVQSIPTVMAFDYRGLSYTVRDRYHILEELSTTQPTENAWKNIDQLKRESKEAVAARMQELVTMDRNIRKAILDATPVHELILIHSLRVMMSSSAVGLAFISSVATQLIVNKLLPRALLRMRLQRQFTAFIEDLCAEKPNTRAPDLGKVGFVASANFLFTLVSAQQISAALYSQLNPSGLYSPIDPTDRFILDLAESSLGILLGYKFLSPSRSDILSAAFFLNKDNASILESAREAANRDVLDRIRSGQLECDPQIIEEIEQSVAISNSRPTVQFSGWDQSAKGFVESDVVGNSLILLPAGLATGVAEWGTAALNDVGTALFSSRIIPQLAF
ncbi:MAG: hypothetical protein COV45_02610 [Deltaproteobacteria bacterium CG11_big_fil_rev_8_21_14_0_20_47_16]|nr:MAG: hypothetical protein COV45_02610 [Deltaproteobacteria bacterium CG11_big_fil_rev_8_21_14_0_20_47_16]